MKKVPRYIFLTKGKVAIVDWDDYDTLAQHHWTFTSTGYARRQMGRKYMLLHREILGGVPPNIDHINHNKLDNRSCNLRPCKFSENVRNRVQRLDSSRQYKGVHKVSGNRSRPYVARLCVDGLHYRVAAFATEEEAARAYDRLAREYHGEFACLNFPEAACGSSSAA